MSAAKAHPAPFVFTCQFCARGACIHCPGVLSDAARTACVCTHDLGCHPEAGVAPGAAATPATPVEIAGPSATSPVEGPALTAEEIDLQLGILATLMNECKARDEALRKQRRETLRPGQRSPVVLPGEDTELAWVSMTKPSKGGAVTASVVDVEALLRWCREHRPDAITETVRTSDQSAILAEVKETGEAVPGVELGLTSGGTAQLRVNVEDGAFAALLEAVQSGRVDVLKAITGGAS